MAPERPSSNQPVIFVPPSIVTAPPTTTTVPPVPVPSTGGALPQLSPGESQVICNGVPESVQVVVEQQTDLVLRGDDFELRVAGECTSSCTIENSPDGRQILRLEKNGLAKVSGFGFEPGTPVYVWLFSGTTFPGELEVGADGRFSGRVPLGSAPMGSHTLQVNGTGADGSKRTAAFVRASNQSGWGLFNNSAM